MFTLGYPFDKLTLWLFIKSCLDRCNEIIEIFKENMPDLKFAIGFILRHKDAIPKLIYQNIVSRSVLQEYLENLKKEIENVSMTNLVNCNETIV